MDPFEQATHALKHALKSEVVPALEGAVYTDKHRVFEAASPQRARIANAISAQVAKLASDRARPITVLSVGCGDGALDLAILDKAGSDIELFCGLDANADQISAFAARAHGRANVELIVGDRLASLHPRRFDLVYAIHLIYYVGDVGGFLDSLAQVAMPGGQIIVAVAPKSPMNVIADLFWREQGTEALFADDFADLLDQRGQTYTRQMIHADILLSHYLGPQADQDVIDFTVQAECAGLSVPARAALDRAFEAAAFDGTRGPALDHPVELFAFRTA